MNGRKIIIHGAPLHKWTEVQSIQHRTFIYIMSNGSKWAGEAPDNIEILLDVLARYELEPWASYTDNPCASMINPAWRSNNREKKYLPSSQLYHVPVVRFFGNFRKLSHVFNIDTNDLETIYHLKLAMDLNREFYGISA